MNFHILLRLLLKGSEYAQCFLYRNASTTPASLCSLNRFLDNFLYTLHCTEPVIHQVPDPASLSLIWDTLPASEKGKDEINFGVIGPGVKV